MHCYSSYRGSRGRRKKERHWEIFEEIIVETFPIMGEEIVNPVQEALKEKYTKTHINQANRDWAQRKNIKSSTGKATSNIHGETHAINSWFFSTWGLAADHSAKSLQARREWPDIFKVLKEKIKINNYARQRSHSELMEKSKALQTSKSYENLAPPNQPYNKY